MNTILVWLFVSAGGNTNQTPPSVLLTFKAEAQCLHVLQNIPAPNYNGKHNLRCIQAEIIK